ncbi:trifunctional UDP-glucose 4,6-dehydratase/UDP-4-keto-6-deoxy-D-glucose 3,5-epimerase/UDP-4-keto-L-rhamnose-reductase RHM1 [Tanacetum coccineum]
MVVDKFVNEKDESLSFDKELDVSLGSQIAVEFTESLYFSPTGILKDRQHQVCREQTVKDQRYFLDAEKLKCLGWSERTTWQEGLNETTDWYTSNPDWWVDVSGALLRQPRMLMMLDEVGEVIDVPKNCNIPKQGRSEIRV